MRDPRADQLARALTRKRRLRLALRLAVIAAIAGGLWFFVHKLDTDELGTAFGRAKIWPLVVCAGLNFCGIYSKSACWHIMLGPRYHVKTARLFRYAVASFAASAIAPARAGEVLRVWILKRRDGVPPADTAAVAVAEKLLDGISMLILIAPVPWLLPDLPRWVGAVIGLCAGIALLLFVALFIAVGRVEGESAGRWQWLRRFIAGMHVLRNPKRLLAALGTLFVVWAIDLTEVLLVLYAVGVPQPVAAGLLILFTLNLTIMLPSTPAQVGALEVGALAGADLLHIARAPALAFAVLYHAVQVIPVIIGGLAFEHRLVLGQEHAGD